MDLVQGVARGGVGEQTLLDGRADGLVDAADLVLCRGGRDVELGKEGRDDFLFFLCCMG